MSDDEKVSELALVMAYLRGYHAAHDSPKIFDDFLAHQIVGGEVCARLEQVYLSKPSLEFAEHLGFKGVASTHDKAYALSTVIHAFSPLPLPVSRARYVEDRLEQAVRQGAQQYVILGAGLDTFAFRRPDLVSQLQVFEVDRPAMLEFKRRRLADLGWRRPAQLRFVPIDFQRESSSAALARAGYDARAPSFFSWMGVTYYLTREAVFATCANIAELASGGGEVVFDYAHEDVFVPERTSPLTQLALKYLREKGEPWLTGFNPSRFAADLARTGLILREDLSPHEIQRRFFEARTDGYRAYELVHFASAAIERA